MRFWIAGICGILFLLFFHIVPYHNVVFPKASPSFADTFINLNEYLKRYNEGSVFDQIFMQQTYIFRQLREKGLIVKVNKEDQKTDEN
jgi:hypothetical protein